MACLHVIEGGDRAAPSRRVAATEAAARDWLETQARVVSYWRDLLLEHGGDVSLVAALEEHAAFLRSAARG